jgi:hypothetical protein
MIARGDRPEYRVATAQDGRWRVDTLPWVPVTATRRREALDEARPVLDFFENLGDLHNAGYVTVEEIRNSWGRSVHLPYRQSGRLASPTPSIGSRVMPEPSARITKSPPAEKTM